MAHVLVITAKRYNGHELWTALGVLQSRGHSFDVASTSLFIADEITDETNRATMFIGEVESMNKYDGLVFISGNMQDTESHWTNGHMLRLVDEAYAKNVPVAAICCSTPMVRNIVRGKRVSVFPLIRIRTLMENAGAIISNASLSTDGLVVTAENQMLTQMWIENFCDLLEGKPPTHNLEESSFRMSRRERKPIPELEHLKSVTRKTGKTSLTKDGKDE